MYLNKDFYNWQELYNTVRKLVIIFNDKARLYKESFQDDKDMSYLNLDQTEKVQKSKRKR